MNQLEKESPTLTPRYPIADLHSHALLHIAYLRKDLSRRHRPPRFWNPLRSQLDLPRMRAAGVSLQVFTVYVPFRFPGKTYSGSLAWMLACFETFIQRNEALIGHARSFAEVEDINRSGRIAAVLAVEGGHVLDGRIENLELLGRSGVLYLTLTHFRDNDIAGSSWGRGGGLTDFGREVIRNLPRARIFPDLAHASERAFSEVLELHPGPVLWTHGGLRKFADSPRNLSDDQARAVAETGGLIGLFLHPWLLKRPSLIGGPEVIADSFAHLGEIAGPERACLGTDFDGWIVCLRGVRGVDDLPMLFDSLEPRLGPEGVERLAGGNLYRFLRGCGF